MNNNLSKFILIVIIVIGFALRVINLDKFPPAVSWDEISHGYNAYSILKTGADEWGQKLPILNFRAYGDYPLPLNLYITIPSIFIFGLNEFSIRLPHAILGVLTAISAYFLTLAITNRKSASLLATFLVSIEPWTFFTSRVVLQQNISVFLLTASIAAFFNREKNKYLLPASLFFFFLTLFAYHSTRIFSPLFLIASIVIYRNEIIGAIKRGRFMGILLGTSVLAFFVIAGVIVMEPNARARAQWLFIVNQGAINKIVENRQSSALPPLISRLIYNRPTYFISAFTKNYIEYLSPQFLFFGGGTQYQYSLPERGLSYLINLPLFYLGVFILLKKVKSGSKGYQLLLAWLALSPIAGSITSEHFAVTRASVILPLPQILTSLGGFFVYDFLKAKWGRRFRSLLVAFYFIVIFLFIESYMVDYFTKYPKAYSWAWQYGYRQVVEFAKDNYASYDKIIVTKKYGEPHEFFLFFWNWDPERFKSDPNLIRYYQSGWYWVDRFDKFYFVNDWEVPKDKAVFILESKKEKVDCTLSDLKCLLITSPGNAPQGWEKLETINFLDGKPAFEIYENN